MGMSREDQEFVSRVGQWFYGSRPNKVNEALGNVVAEMLQKVIEGTKAMHLVPRPTGILPGWTWLVSQAGQSLWRSIHEDKVYIMVKDAVAVSYKFAYYDAQIS